MKIAMVCLSNGDAIQSRRIAALSAALVRQGHHLKIYTGRQQTAEPDGLDSIGDTFVIRGPTATLGTDAHPHMLKDLGAFTQFLEDQWWRDTPDVAHAHSWSAGLAAQLAARAQRIPTVQSFHVLANGLRGAEAAGTQTRRRLEALVARGSSWLIASHAAQMEQLGGMGGRRSRTSLVPWGVDPDAFTPRETASPCGERHRILTVASDSTGQGCDTLIQSLRWVPNAELLIIGKVAADDPASAGRAARLMTLASGVGVADRVSLYGEVPHGEMPALLRTVDVVAYLPEHPTFGTVALEAMACGLPVVASAVGGLADTVVSDITGRIVSPYKPRECAESILLMLKHPFIRNSLGAAGRDRARSRYSWDRIGRDTARVYDRLIPETADDVPTPSSAGSR
ncbi:glycosyltransferase [Mycobacterium sp. BMJ-28]